MARTDSIIETLRLGMSRLKTKELKNGLIMCFLTLKRFMCVRQFNLYNPTTMRILCPFTDEETGSENLGCSASPTTK